MESWKPLEPTPRHQHQPLSGQAASASSSHEINLDAYAAPPQSTRQAPPAHPHPPAARQGGNAKRRSFLPSWASRGTASSSQYASVGGGTPSKPTIGGSKVLGQAGVDAAAAEEEDWVGSLPVAVHARVIGFLQIDDLVRYMTVCRSAASLVAREEVWRARVDRVAWKAVSGVHVALPAGPSDVTSTEPRATAPKNGPDKLDNEWGEFTGEANIHPFSDTGAAAPFDDWPDHPDRHGGSLANGMASLHTAARPASSNTSRSLFSFKAATQRITCLDLPSYGLVKSYKAALQPFCESLRASKSDPEESLLFTGPDSFEASWGAIERARMLGNLIRAALPAPQGGGLFSSETPDRSPDLAMLGEDDGESAGATPFLVGALARSASLQTSQLLSAFTASSDRRADALKASSYGAKGTEAAVTRAEGDMRVFATALWDLGRDADRLTRHDKGSYEAQGGDTGYADGGSDSALLGLQAKDAWLSSRFIDLNDLPSESTTARTDFRHNFVMPTSGQAFTPTLNFTPMDGVMSHLVTQFRAEGEIIARVFPPEQQVLLAWADQILVHLLSNYIQPMLDFALSHSVHLYLRCCAATFAQSMRLADAVCTISPPSLLPEPTALSSRTSAQEDLRLESLDWSRRFAATYREEACKRAIPDAWHTLIRAYLEQEQTWVRDEMEAVAHRWQEDLANQSVSARTDAAFLASQNPAAVKRSVLAGFKNVLLLPVTVVPRTAVHVGGAVFRTAGKGVSQLNPLNWQSSTATNTQGPVEKVEKGSVFSANLGRSKDDGSKANVAQGYMDFSEGGSHADDGPDVYDEEGDEAGDDGTDGQLYQVEDEWSEEVRAWKEVAQKATQASSEQQKRSALPQTGMTRRPGATDSRSATPLSRPSSTAPATIHRDMDRGTTRKGLDGNQGGTPRSATPVSRSASKASPASLQRMQLLLSLDTALEMIHLNRDSLKRIETFVACPGEEGERAKATIEEVASSFLRCLGEHHVTPGFEKATEQVRGWEPSAHPRASSEQGGGGSGGDGNEAPTGDHVEPLVHFFELVHVGDTISQMVQVYFTQELSRHVDQSDFLNSVVREKKRFESGLDEAVAAGLNAGVDLLMSQAEHLITTRQDPRDFYPEAGKDMDLGRPTSACSEAVECLRTHCRLLVGCADKSILEVFWQEIGLRLHSILCKHLKRQIISLDGGFKVIADLNAYHGFVAGLKQPSLMVYFDALKMLGNVFIIENPRELAQLVRDASLFRGTLTPDDVYEFLQARCDFKAIEAAVDKEMYGFKIAEDCAVM
ncbi:unnamed protein product [Parajaminaea phylloscopi]